MADQLPGDAAAPGGAQILVADSDAGSNHGGDEAVAMELANESENGSDEDAGSVAGSAAGPERKEEGAASAAAREQDEKGVRCQLRLDHRRGGGSFIGLVSSLL